MLKNLFDNLVSTSSEEKFETILETNAVRIERIVSRGHSSPADFWYDQSENEWVLVLQGSAKIRFDPQKTVHSLLPGDFLNIPIHQRHRVEQTSPDEPTVWLAIYYP